MTGGRRRILDVLSMTDGRRRILDMLSEGKITVDEAERLLKALNGGSHPEDRVGDATEGRLNPLDRLGESLASELENSVREKVTVVLGEKDQAPVHDDTFEVGDSPRLHVQSFKGLVRVTAGEPGSIRVRAKLSDPRTVEYSAVQQGDTIKVEASPRGRSSGFLSGLFGSNFGLSIEVTAPNATELDLTATNGLVEVDGMKRGGTILTSNGAVRVADLEGELSATTGNGTITVKGFQGSAKLTSSNGPISIEDGQGGFEVQSSNGAITLQGDLEPGSRNSLATSNGGIKVALEGEPSLRLTASTVNGRVRCEIPGFVASEDSHHQRPRRHGGRARKLEGTVGEGEAELVAQTVNGTITVRQAGIDESEE